MWNLVLISIFVFGMVFAGHGTRARNELKLTNRQSSIATHHSLPFSIIAKQLQKAIQENSPRKRQKALLRVRELVQQLPMSPVTDQLKGRLERALRTGIMSGEAEDAIDEAIEIAKSADKMLRQNLPSIDPEVANATLLRVLSSPEFQMWNPITKFLQWISKRLEKPINWVAKQLGAFFRWLGRVLRPILEWLSRFFEALGAWLWHWWQLLKAISPALAWTTVVLIGAVSLAFLLRAILKWWREKQKVQMGIAVAETLIIPEQLLREAENDAKLGDYLTALRKTYKALLLFLDRVGLIRFREQRTNWEYLAEVRKKASSEWTWRFQEVTNIFDRCFYARKAATANELSAVRQFVEETRLQARSLLKPIDKTGGRIS